jgi:hypothetical protein
MQYTLVIETQPSRNGGERFTLKNFKESSEVISYVSELSKGNHKVYKIFSMLWTGETQEMTIGFENGKLSLIKV